MTFYDLEARIRGLAQTSSRERMVEAAKALPAVGLVALNGIPFIGDPPTYFGTPITPQTLQTQVRLGLGFGGVLTYMNSSALTLDELAVLSLKHDHDWAMRNISVTLCFANTPTFVEMSFARDGRFHLSWVEPKGAEDWSLPRIFTASASLKDWKKYVANRNSPDFLPTQRSWLDKAHAALYVVCPEYFT